MLLRTHQGSRLEDRHICEVAYLRAITFRLHCEKLQATVDRLVAERAEHRDRALDDLALVRRPDSSPATHAENPIEPAAPAAPTQKAFEDVAEILSDHHVRMSKVEFRVSSDTGSTSPTAAQSSIAQLESSMTDLKRRIAPLEAQSGGTSGSGSESVKQDKKVIRTLVRIAFLHRMPLSLLTITAGTTPHHHAAGRESRKA